MRAWVTPHDILHRPRVSRSDLKPLLCIFWNSSGVLYYGVWKMVKRWLLMFIVSNWLRLRASIVPTTAGHQKRYGPMPLHGRARLHAPIQTKNCLSVLHFDILLGPSYNPDINSPIFHLFQSLQHVPADKAFSDAQEVKTGCLVFLPQKPWI